VDAAPFSLRLDEPLKGDEVLRVVDVAIALSSVVGLEVLRGGCLELVELEIVVV
jgi:hypothetical protein